MEQIERNVGDKRSLNQIKKVVRSLRSSERGGEGAGEDPPRHASPAQQTATRSKSTVKKSGVQKSTRKGEVSYNAWMSVQDVSFLSQGVIKENCEEKEKEDYLHLICVLFCFWFVCFCFFVYFVLSSILFALFVLYCFVVY